MTRNPIRGALVFLLLFLATNPAAAQVRLGEKVADFPPGPCTDGRSYRIADMEGTLVVLYFFESR